MAAKKSKAVCLNVACEGDCLVCRTALGDPPNPERAVHDNEDDWWDEI